MFLNVHYVSLLVINANDTWLVEWKLDGIINNYYII